MQRIFLGWERPAVEAAADLLIREHRNGQWLDLTGVGVVVPGRRAGRRLQQRLTEKAAAAALHFLPPRLTTMGGLPEWCYQGTQSLASPTVQQWSWARAITRIDPKDRELLIGVTSTGTAPTNDRDSWPWPMILQKSYLELASDGWRFTDIAAKLDSTVDASTRQFWQALARTEIEYQRVLQEHGLTDLQQARFQVAEANQCHVDGPLYLLALVELPRLTVRMLEQAGANVTALVFAPAAWEDRFDASGRLIPEAWRTLPVPLTDDQWTVTRGHAKAAECAAQFVTTHRQDDPVIGVGDESLIPFLQRSLSLAGISAHWAAGDSFQNSSAWRLLAMLRNYARTPRVAELTQWSRHPDVEAWLLRAGVAPDFLSKLDRHFESALPLTRLPHSRSGSESIDSWSQAMARLQQMLPMEQDSLVEHVRSLTEFFGEVLQGRELNRDDADSRKTLAAYEALASRLCELSELPKELAPTWGFDDTLEWLMDDLAGQSIPDEPEVASIELLGWLELLLDDSPALCITGFYEGSIPEAMPKNDLLSPSIREAFQLTDESRRFAREVYILSTFVQTRSELLAIAQQVGSDEDPVYPSRLLFPREPEELVRRWYRVLHSVPTEETDVRSTTRAKGPARPAISQFTIPDLTPYFRPVTRLSVTQFRSFLACPYRFFLEHVLKLRTVDHLPLEMSPPIFGDFSHQVLAQFGRSDQRYATDEKIILDTMMDFHRALATEQFGEDISPIVRLQLAQLERRWRYFANVQAKHAAEGWVIQFVEQPDTNDPIPFLVDEEPFELVGRIDRIDVNSSTNETMIIDYKTSETGESPKSKHYSRKDGWKDLQLPLYRYIAKSMGLVGPFQLAYFNLAKSMSHFGIEVALWSDAELELADQAAHEVIRRIRNNDYGQPTDPPPKYSDTWSWICLDDVREFVRSS